MVIDNHSQGRLSWVDNVKMLAMLFVILGHTWRIIHCPLPDWLNLFILSFNMPLFVIMTGYTSVNAISSINSMESFGGYMMKITNRILVPSAVFGCIMDAFFQISKFLITREIEIPLLIFRIAFVVLFIIVFILRSNGKWVKMYTLMTIVAIPTAIFASPFWFFSMIWCVCISVAVAALIVNSINWGGDLLLYLIAFAVSLVMSLIYDKTSDFVHFLLLGLVIRKYGIIDKIDRTSFMVFAFIVGLVMITWLGEDPMNFWDNHFINMLQNGTIYLYFLRLLASTLLSLFFISFVKRISGQYSGFSFWGAQTLPLYLVHVFIVTVFFKLPINYTINNSMVYLLYAIPMTLILTLSSMFIIRQFMKYGITKVLLLGEKM